MTTATALASYAVIARTAFPAPTWSSAAGQSDAEPFGGEAMRSHAAVMDHLESRNEDALVRTVAEAAHVLSPAERPLACWIPCLMGLEEARCSGRPLACASSVAFFIAVSVRVALTHFPVLPRAPWLVGSSMIDQSAAHLIALLLARRGVSAKPWWAPDLPRRGAYLLVTTLDEGELDVDDQRFLGTLSLAQEARFARSRPLEKSIQ